jgi:hypothetical protein
MAAKKTGPSKGKPSKKPRSSRKSSSEFRCPNPESPLSLEEIIRTMEQDYMFAEFIRDLLCSTYSSDPATREAAQDCLDSYYKPTSAELTLLCIPKALQAAYRACTDPQINALIRVPATYWGRGQGLKRR